MPVVWVWTFLLTALPFPAVFTGVASFLDTQPSWCVSVLVGCFYVWCVWVHSLCVVCVCVYSMCGLCVCVLCGVFVYVCVHGRCVWYVCVAYAVCCVSSNSGGKISRRHSFGHFWGLWPPLVRSSSRPVLLGLSHPTPRSARLSAFSPKPRFAFTGPLCRWSSASPGAQPSLLFWRPSTPGQGVRISLWSVVPWNQNHLISSRGKSESVLFT